MHFQRPRVVNNDFSPPWVVQTQMTDLRLGDGSGGTTPVTSDYTESATVEQNLSGNSKVYIHLHVNSLGTATGVIGLIEFQDPVTGDWIPSKARISGAGGVEEPLDNSPL
jgi:hypothetical protein